MPCIAAHCIHATEDDILLLRERGIVVGRGGHDDNVVKISPPLVIEAGVLMEAIDQVAATIRETAD